MARSQEEEGNHFRAEFHPRKNVGVALTGSDTSSNVLFGGLQRITAEQIGISRS